MPNKNSKLPATSPYINSPYVYIVPALLLLFLIYYIYILDTSTTPFSSFFSLPPDPAPFLFYTDAFWHSLLTHTFAASLVLTIPLLFPVFVFLFTLEFAIYGLCELVFNFQAVKTYLLTGGVDFVDVILISLAIPAYLALAYDSHLLSPYYWISLFQNMAAPATTSVDSLPAASPFVTTLDQYRDANFVYIIDEPDPTAQLRFILLSFALVGLLVGGALSNGCFTPPNAGAGPYIV